MGVRAVGRWRAIGGERGGGGEDEGEGDGPGGAGVGEFVGGWEGEEGLGGLVLVEYEEDEDVDLEWAVVVGVWGGGWWSVGRSV